MSDSAHTSPRISQANEQIILTERAAQQVRKIREEQQVPEHQYLRVAVNGGGCAGMSYGLDFDEKSEKDQLVESCGIQMVVDKHHLLYLSGVKLDFNDGLDARGFEFINPNAESTCGCGSSFSA